MVVGLLESLMTATIVDDLTDSKSNKNRECVGQGVANIATGFIGGMAGCAMIGQTVINVKSGGRGRLSTFSGGRLPAADGGVRQRLGRRRSRWRRWWR
jgi:SulP family sulfate permease